MIVTCKLKKRKTHILILISSLIYNCKSIKRLSTLNEVVEIYSWNKCGDKGGRFRSLKIRKDSTIMISGTRNLTDTIKNKTDYLKWKKMTELLNVEDFTKFKSGQIGNLQSEGCISGISIKTKDSIYSKSGIIFNKLIEESETIDDFIRKTSR